MAETVFKRKIYDEILEWKKNRSDKYALLIKGARRVGKSTIAEEFAKNEFRSYILIDFAHTSKAILELFDDTYNLDFFFLQLQQLTGVRLYEKESVIIFDEVQLLPKARQAIKYLVADGRYKYIETGALLSIKKNTKDILIPSEEHKISMYPMDFEEFLMAHNQDALIDKIKECFNKNEAMGLLHEKALSYYKQYLLSGGMPDSISELLKCNNDFYNYDLSILNNIIEDYKNDMNNHVNNPSETLKIRKIYSSLSSQLQNASKKFQYSVVEQNAKSREFSSPLDWLVESNMVQVCMRVKLPEKPLLGFADEDTFKVYYSDVGIFNRLINNDAKTILLDDMKIYKGIITENYVANQFKANGIDLLYWQGKRESEVDFLITSKNDGVIPVEVKADNNTQSKSLGIYDSLYSPKYMIRISSKDFGYNPTSKIKSIPLYAAFLIKNL